MTIETKQIEGEIQNVRKDFKAIEISNEWFNFFNPNKELVKGDKVKIIYTEKKKEDKVFNNIKNVEIIKEARVIPVKAITLSDPLSSQDKNTIIITAKDLFINNPEYTLEEWIDRVKYNRIKL